MIHEEYYDYITEKFKEEETEWRQLILFHQKLDYEISNTGLIRSMTTKEILRVSFNPEIKNCYGFKSINLLNGTKYNTEIHRLVAIMFIEIPDKYIKQGLTEKDLTVNHKDRIRWHNNVDNLEWMTSEENARYRDEREKCIIDELIADRICKLLADGYPIFIIANDLGISEDIVTSIRYRNTWTDVSKYYTFPSKQLTETTVRIICEYLAKGYTQDKISEITGAPVSSISHKSAGDSWTEISSEYVFPQKRLTKEEVILICECLEKGMRPSAISKQYDISKRAIEHIQAKKTHTDISKNYNIVVKPFKVDDEVVHNICKDIISKEYYIREIAERNNVSITFVKDLKKGKHRKDICKQYGLSK